MSREIVKTVLPDAAERERAATTFDRNVVVTAGAGTGKTTLLVDRLTHLLMREPHPLTITQVVALTFTNKAANEMRVRLRERLQSYLSARLDQEPVRSEQVKLHAELRLLIELYHLTKDEIDRRAREALRQIERSYIGTIHSFAALLLRLYPIEAGVDPQFKEDDGSIFKKLFDEEWSEWLDRELGRDGTRHQTWKQVLARIPLDHLREVAFALCSEIIPIERVSEIARARETEPNLSRWLAEQEVKIQELVERYPEPNHQIDAFARHCLSVVRGALKMGELANGKFEEEKRWFAEKTLRRAGKWTEEDFEMLQRFCRLARGLILVNRRLTQSLFNLLIPFAEQYRASFIRQGFVSFDGLLVRARNLLRDNRALREELKYLFKAILIDEFQDSDPIQYEILLYLVEKPGKSAAEWQSIRLEPGKVFVVGDPKQSIYAFRRADIQGYLDVVQKIVLAQGGIECPLTTNFRSHAGILDVVNGVFEPLICERAGLQPAYVPIQPPSIAENVSSPLTESSFRKVVLCKIESRDELRANAARRLEAETLAQWLHDEVLGRAKILNRHGEWIAAQPKHVAFLFRRLTEVHLYLEPLRRQGIPYVVEGEKHFYATQEIVDGVNLLRAVSNPHDRAALIGILRSPIGGLSDREIYDLQCGRLLDYRSVGQKRLSRAKNLEPLRNLYATLDRLHSETRTLSVADAVNRIFAAIPIRILAATSFGGEQAVANIEKIRQQASIMGRGGLSTLKDVIAQLERRVLEMEEESESALAEESVDAVKILSIHKAKGLEFPIVVLPDGRGANHAGRTEIGVRYDWSSDLIGLRTTDHVNLAAIYLDERRRIREEEEQKRLFYVAMTRAREHVMISVPALKVDNGSFVAMLDRSAGMSSAPAGRASIPVGNGTIDLRALDQRRGIPRRPRQSEWKLSAQGDWGGFIRQWNERSRRYESALKKPFFVSPTALKKREIDIVERFELKPALPRETDALLLGSLAHGFLEQLDFSASPDRFEEDLVRYLERQPDSRLASKRPVLLQELHGILTIFFRSRVFSKLRSAKIFGREVPLLMPWNGQIMEGVIDLIYEKQGRLYLADYKTDRIEKRDLEKASQPYRQQAAIYAEAARRGLQKDVEAFELIFLRLGESVCVNPCAVGLFYTSSN
jgi:ATP-dependent helicase/nuclease subunit A